MRQLAGDIHVEPTLRKRIQIVGIALPVPGQAIGQHREGDVLDAFHQLDQPVAICRLAGCEADAAIAHHHGGDPVPGRGLHACVPRRLAVIVGVDIDKARRDDLAARVDLLGAGGRDPPDARDPPILHTDIGFKRRCAGSVHDGPAPDHQIISLFHRRLLPAHRLRSSLQPFCRLPRGCGQAR